MPKFTKGHYSWNIFKNLHVFKSESGHLLIITNQFTKFQGSNSNSVLVLQTHDAVFQNLSLPIYSKQKKSKRKVQGVPQSQTAALHRHQEREETDKSKQAQIEQTYEKH